ncbi:10249_t:CDS:2, partial [Dentiscutata heterogama]
MSKLKTTPPLVSLRSVNTAQEVEIRLHEPLIQKQGSRKKRIGLQILNALARLEVLLNKEEALAISEDAVQHLTQVRVCAKNSLFIDKAAVTKLNLNGFRFHEIPGVCSERRYIENYPIWLQELSEDFAAHMQEHGG